MIDRGASLQMKAKIIWITGVNFGSMDPSILERTITITGIREWGEVTVTATAGGPDAFSIAGWKAFMRLREAEPGTVHEGWVAHLERPENAPPFWNWLKTGMAVGSQMTALTIEEFAKLIEAARGEKVTAEDATRILLAGMAHDDQDDTQSTEES